MREPKVILIEVGWLEATQSCIVMVMRDAWKAACLLQATEEQPARLLSRRSIAMSPHAAVAAFTPMEGEDASLWAWWWWDKKYKAERDSCLDPRVTDDQFTITRTLLKRVKRWFEETVAANSWPQLVVAAREDADYVVRLSRWLMEMPDAEATELGRYLAWFGDRADIDGQSSLITLDEVYAREWVRAVEGEWGTWIQPPVMTPASMAPDVGFDEDLEKLLTGLDQVRQMGGVQMSIRKTKAEDLLHPWVTYRGESALQWWEQYLREKLPKAPAAKWRATNEAEEARRWSEDIQRSREYNAEHPTYTTQDGFSRPRTLRAFPASLAQPHVLAMAMMQREAYASFIESRRIWEDDYGRRAAAVRGNVVVGYMQENTLTSKQPTLKIRPGDELCLYDPQTQNVMMMEETTVIGRVERTTITPTQTDIHMTMSAEWDGHGWWLPKPVTEANTDDALYRSRARYQAKSQPRVYAEQSQPLAPLSDEPRLDMLESLRRKR